ncbi:hypothetical protein KGV55_00320 [Candidatus Gracilibacteria bacterium]|nr:hypothetical protein [Candidatus Gracilibacteria bacterium]
MKKYSLYISDFLRYFLYFFLEQLGISLMIGGVLILSVWGAIWTFTFFLKIQGIEKMAGSLNIFQYVYEYTQGVGGDLIDIKFLFLLAVFLGTRFFLCTTIASITIGLLNKKFNWIPEPRKWLKANIERIIIGLHFLSVGAVITFFISITDFSEGIIQIILGIGVSWFLGFVLFLIVMLSIILPGGLLYLYFTPKLSEETEKAIISFYKNLLK